MTTPVNCPNCGSQLPPSAPSCARCGLRFDEVPEVVEEAVSPSPPARRPQPEGTPPRPASVSRPIASSQQPFSAYLNDARERWGIDASPYFIGVIVLAALAFLAGTFAHYMVLSASSDDFAQRSDFFTWLTTADALALGALVGAILVRQQASRDPVAADVRSPDFKIAMALVGLTLIYALVGVVLGMGGRFDAAASWERYAAAWSFATAAWFVLSRPLPEMIGTTKTVTIGLIAGGVSAVLLLIGHIQGLSNNNDSYVTGVMLQSLVLTVLSLGIGWFLGMQPKR